MKNCIPYLLIFILFSLSISAQNLVINPSFEQYTLCPPGMSAIQQYMSYATGWKDMEESPDYFNVCNTGGAGVPKNTIGYQQARTGVAYAGIFKDNYLPSLEGREYIRGSLICPLDSGTEYEVSFYVNQAEDYDNCSNNFGVYFTTDVNYKIKSLSYIGKYHILDTVMICDTANWVQVKGTFTADSAYAYFIIGNPLSKDSTTFLLPPQGSLSQLNSYYYIDDVSVVPLNSIDDSIVGDSSICYKGSATYTGPQDNDIISYEWIIPSGLSLTSGQNTYSASIKADSIGMYQIQLVINRGCVPDTLLKSITVDTLFYSNLNDTSFCNGSSVSIDVSSLGISYTWYDNSSASSNQIDTAGSYWVEIFDGNCLTHYDFSTSLISYPTAQLNGLDSLCEGDQVQFFISADSATTSYIWSFSNNFSLLSSQNSDSIVLQAQSSNNNALIQIIYQNTCEKDTLSKNVYIANTPSVSLGNDTILCTGSTILLDAGSDGTNYNWSTGNTTNQITIIDSSTYWVEVSNWNCFASDTINISKTISPSIVLGKDTIICSSKTIILIGIANADVNYLWSTGETSSQITVSDSGTYWLMATSISGCGNDADSITIGMQDCDSYFYIPNTFSPNSDGKNDFFIPKGIGVENFSMEIFDRWGQSIFSSTSLNDAWDGKLNSQELMMGVYVYKISYSLIENDFEHTENKIGRVTLLR